MKYSDCLECPYLIEIDDGLDDDGIPDKHFECSRPDKDKCEVYQEEWIK